MDEYLAKPFDAGDLFAKIEGLLPASAADHDDTPAREEISGQVFSRSALLARVNGDTALRNALVSLFLDDHPRLLAAVERAVALRKGDEIAIAAHTLKEALSALSADRAADATSRLERSRGGDLAHIDGAHTALADELSALLL